MKIIPEAGVLIGLPGFVQQDDKGDDGEASDEDRAHRRGGAYAIQDALILTCEEVI